MIPFHAFATFYYILMNASRVIIKDGKHSMTFQDFSLLCMSAPMCGVFVCIRAIMKNKSGTPLNCVLIKSLSHTHTHKANNVSYHHRRIQQVDPFKST